MANRAIRVSLRLLAVVVIVGPISVWAAPQPAPAADPNGFESLSFLDGFDSCEQTKLTPTDMLDIWNNTSFFDFYFYIGGESANCVGVAGAPPATWVSDTENVGWNFLPIYVGLQAPCTTGKGETMSLNEDTAFTQGVQDAQYAQSDADNYGFADGTVIALDIEGYASGPGHSTCITQARASVEHFVDGWDNEMLDYTDTTVIYGSASGSYPEDWATISPSAYIPNEVWLAGGFPGNGVYDNTYIPNTYWDGYQRLAQWDYSNLSIPNSGLGTFPADFDCANAWVAGLCANGSYNDGNCPTLQINSGY